MHFFNSSNERTVREIITAIIFLKFRKRLLLFTLWQQSVLQNLVKFCVMFSPDIEKSGQ